MDLILTFCPQLQMIASSNIGSKYTTYLYSRSTFITFICKYVFELAVSGDLYMLNIICVKKIVIID